MRGCRDGFRATPNAAGAPDEPEGAGRILEPAGGPSRGGGADPICCGRPSGDTAMTAFAVRCSPLFLALAMAMAVPGVCAEKAPADASSSRFKALDANNDGVLSRREFNNARRG